MNSFQVSIALNPSTKLARVLRVVINSSTTSSQSMLASSYEIPISTAAMAQVRY